jgi:hypothetical protein
MTIPICCVQSTASSPLMYVTCTSPGVAADTGGRNGPAYFPANEIRRFLVTHRLRLLRWTTSPAMSLPSLTVVSHRGRLSGSQLRLFWCATSSSMCLLSLTVVSHSRRRIRIPPPRHTRLCRLGRWICRSWGGFGFEGPGGLVGAVIFGCLGLGWLLAFVIFHAVSILSRVFADASVCAYLVPL